MDDKVVITGAGLISSLGYSASETWNAIVSGKKGVKPIEDLNGVECECCAAARANDLDPLSIGIHPRDARIMDKHSHMLLKCSQDAFKEAGFDTASIPAEETGFFAGIGMVDYNIGDLLPAVLKSLDSRRDIDYDIFYSDGYQEIYPLWPLSMLNNISFCQVAIALGIKGENAVFSPHGDSGMLAIIEAANSVIERKARAALAGGVSEKISPLSISRASFFGILNTSDGECRPFEESSEGTMLGEGCGILTIESVSSAENRKAPYDTAITGYGCSYEKDAGAYCPTSRSIAATMQKALRRSGLHPSDIDLIIAHGDGTDIGDRNEIVAIHQIFANSLESLNVYSSKGALGHMLAGAPAVDTVLGTYMLKSGVVPAVNNLLKVDKGIRFNIVGEPMDLHPKRILINTQSYEGQSVSLIIEKCTQ